MLQAVDRSGKTGLSPQTANRTQDMTQQDKINYLESELAALKRQVEFISKRFGLLPDENELDRAIELMLTSRDNSALDEYLKRGGKIPCQQTEAA